MEGVVGVCQLADWGGNEFLQCPSWLPGGL